MCDGTFKSGDHILAIQEFKTILNDVLEKGKELDKISSLLAQEKARDPVFDSRVAKNNSTRNIVGIYW